MSRSPCTVHVLVLILILSYIVVELLHVAELNTVIFAADTRERRVRRRKRRMRGERKRERERERGESF